ncbi:chemotaxis protein MotA [Dyadobacter soli]|uniref:Chemotaxis protein MotA n=1 Tax=Dyadobacter soli TaxID=659014 RepID=A0A1G7CUV8_9BACT|nr:MotA/TolQ/ExbB proton channel family protein [Dyadobacter soli]SDE43011.1 chemotaxis protein MotA [Dyadobacter soli]
MLTNKRLYHVAISLVAAVMIWFVLILGASMSSGPGLKRFFEAFGGSFGGYVHAVIYMAFIFGVLEILEYQKFIKKQHEGFKLNLLPVQDQLVLSPDEVAKIKLNVIDLEKHGFSFLLTDFVKRACTQYRNNQSIGETLQVLTAQIDNSKTELEGKLEIARFLINAIASLGFIGTILHLAGSIGLFHLAKTEEGMPLITQCLNVSFDTTFIALFLGLILSYFYHRYLEDLDTFYSRTKSYIIDNLISRIYHPL